MSGFGIVVEGCTEEEVTRGDEESSVDLNSGGLNVCVGAADEEGSSRELFPCVEEVTSVSAKAICNTSADYDISTEGEKIFPIFYSHTPAARSHLFARSK